MGAMPHLREWFVQVGWTLTGFLGVALLFMMSTILLAKGLQSKNPNLSDQRLFKTMSTKCNWIAILNFGTDMSFFLEHCPNTDARFERHQFQTSILGEALIRQPSKALSIYRSTKMFAVPGEKWNALHFLGYLVSKKNVEIVRQFVKVYPEMLAEKDKFGRTPLDNAMFYRDSGFLNGEIIRAMIQ